MRPATATGAAPAAAGSAPRCAPWSIHARTSWIWPAESDRPDEAGGMRPMGSSVVSRWNSGLPSASPGRTWVSMKSAVSSRSSACRVASDAPWHAKQASASTGRTSRWNSTRSGAWARTTSGPRSGKSPAATAAAPSTVNTRRKVIRIASPGRDGRLSARIAQASPDERA